MNLKTVISILFILSTLSSFSQLKQLRVNGAEINYIDTGKGEPIVFVHGSLEDYTTWLPQLERFSKNYRVIAYSRRYNFPNKNAKQDASFTPVEEAGDLEELIKTLGLGKVHLVGHSYGGLTALTLATKKPGILRSLTLSEPAIIHWLPGLAGGEQLLKSFNDSMWQKVRIAFNAKDSIAVLRHTFKYFAGEDLVDKLPAELIDQLKQSLGEWNAIAFSPDAFSGVAKESLRNIKSPILIITAGQTLPLLEPLNKEIVKLLPKAKHFHIADATHDLWMTHPKIVGEELLTFISTVQPR